MFKGRFKIVHTDKGGRIKGIYYVKNGVVNVGLDKILDVMFGAVSKPTDWYIGLIDNDSYSALAASDTMASHPGWPNEFTDYDEGTRQTWDEKAASGQEMTTNTPAVFTIDTDDSEIKGLFIVDNNIKGGSSDTLWSTALFDDVVELDDDDTLKVEYELSASMET